MKVVGYVSSFLGIFFILISKVSPFSSSLSSFFNFIPQTFIDKQSLFVGVVLLLAGIFILIFGKKNSKVLREVPIYEGNKIIGYRRQ